MCMRMCLYVCRYVCTCVCLSVCLYECMYVYTHVCVSTHMYAYTHDTHNTYTLVCTYMNAIYVDVYACVYMCICICISAPAMPGAAPACGARVCCVYFNTHVSWTDLCIKYLLACADTHIHTHTHTKVMNRKRLHNRKWTPSRGSTTPGSAAGSSPTTSRAAARGWKPGVRVCV